MHGAHDSLDHHTALVVFGALACMYAIGLALERWRR